MAKRKQSLPTRAKGAVSQQAASADSKSTVAVDSATPSTKLDSLHSSHSFKLYSAVRGSDAVIDVAEVGLHAAVYETSTLSVVREDGGDGSLAVRLHLSSIQKDFLGCLRALSVEDVKVEVLHKGGNQSEDMNGDAPEGSDSKVIISGYLDCADEAVSGFAYLFKGGYISVKPHVHVDTSDVNGSIKANCRLIVGITQKSFDGCSGLLDGSRSLWSRSTVRVMKWLRPDLYTNEAIYGISEKMPNTSSRSSTVFSETGEQVTEGRSQQAFDPSLLYEALRPDQNLPGLEKDPAGLLAHLRPYQSRAAYWMVMREKSLKSSMEKNAYTITKWPFCVEVLSLDKRIGFFYNPFSGSLSKTAFKSFADIRGGILADEMGLGKTVELLACILTNPSDSSTSQWNEAAENARKELDRNLSKRKRERIACPCGAFDDNYDGIWVQCDICDVWQHAACVGFGMEYEYKEFFEKHLAASKQESKSSRKSAIKKRNCTSDRGIELKEKRYTVSQKYTCGTCAKLIGSVEVEGISGATLIVCPSSILGQWQEEIARHTEKGALKVIIYEGFQRATRLSYDDDQVMGTNLGKVVGAHELAMADIVLTTYNTLQADLSHDNDGDDTEQRAMRYIKRYPVVPTPLTRMKWWRICLDEAQMVESSSARATEMAKRLDAEIRWCITGTPIQRSLDDLHGLLSFLDVQPFCDSFWWTRILKEPYEKNDFGSMNFTHKFLRMFMWRSSKAYVSRELGLPPQEELLTWLTFSAVEAHFYERQHDRCARKALEVMSKGITRNKSCEDRVLTPAEAAKIMHPLLSLRQACCHPQVGSSGLRTLQKIPMTMDEVLKVLIDKAKTEGEEAQRSLVGALNGLAALKILEGELVTAVNLYREALSVIEENSEHFDVDPLQKLHVLHNLQEILNTADNSMSNVLETSEEGQSSKKRRRDEGVNSSTMKAQRQDSDEHVKANRVTDEGNSGISTSERESLHACGIPRTLRDGLLEQQCQDISAKYMSSFYAKLAASRQDYTNSHLEVCRHLKDLEDMKGENWWLDALVSISNDSRQAKELVKKIKASLLEKDMFALSKTGHDNASSLALRFHDLNGLKYILNRELDAIVELRKTLLQTIAEIDDTMKNPSAEQVEQAGNCSKCDQNQNGPLCPICEADQVFQRYENRLFELKSSAASIGEVVSLEDAFTAQQRLLGQKRINTLKMAAGVSGENLAPKSKATEIANIQVTRSPSETESILKLIKANMKQKMGPDFVVTSSKHLELFEAMRKEYAQARLLAFSQRMVLLALDELNMAKTRLCLKFPGEEASTMSDEVFKVHQEEIPQRNAQLTGEKFIALDDLRCAKGQVRYLQGLATTRGRSQKVQCSPSSQPSNKDILQQDAAENTHIRSGANGINMEENCPVCHENLGIQRMILPCGHMLCCKCLITLAENDTVPLPSSERKRISCPSCRCRTPMDNIAFIDNGSGDASYSLTISKLQSKDSTEEASINVDSSYVTKMEAVVRRILRVQASDKSSRFLVFSTWNDVLDVVGHSLTANKIAFIRAKGRRHLNAAIRKFKDVDEPAKVLLLLIQQGANGLNLTEAQHVILVEPLLNPGAEAQAVNRVHRIGQQHSTYVHKFLIKDTVEESIYKLSQLKSQSPVRSSVGRKSNQEVSALTVKDLKILFNDGSDKGSRRVVQQGDTNETASTPVNLRQLPPSIAAAVAAEARFLQARKVEPSQA